MNKVWWSEIHGPSQYIAEIKRSICNNKTVLAQNPGSWQDTFFEQFECSLKQACCEIKTIMLDAKRFGNDNFGFQLMSELCPNSMHLFRPSCDSAGQFIAQSKVLDKKSVIVKNISAETENMWIDLAVDFAKNSRDGSFLMVFDSGKSIKGLNRKGIQILLLDKYCSVFDMLLFSYTCTASYMLSESERQYTSYLAAYMAEDDAELCCDLANPQFMNSPELFLENNVLSKTYEDGFFNINNVRIKIRKAQLAVIFPLIEKQRERMTDKYQAEIIKILPKSDEFDNRITRPDELELRHLLYFVRNGELQFDKADIEFLENLHKARNRLLHSSYLEFNEFSFLLG